MTTGTVKFFNPAKKFGFITPDDGGKDLYLPAGAIATAGVAKLKTGQRVSFDREADPKGDKAANLKLLEQELAAAPVMRQNLAIYLDPAMPESHAVEAAVRAREPEPVLVDYAATPLTVDELKRLTLLLGAAGQSLVRRYHPMFLELRLDDRFISEGEYWTAVAEHPSLINGPVIVAGARAGICKSQKDVVSFFDQSPIAETERKPKQISARLAVMMSGQPVAPLSKAKPAPAASAPQTPEPAEQKAVSKSAVPAAVANPAASAQTMKAKPLARKTAPAQKAPSKTVVKKPLKKTVKPVVKAAKKPPAKEKKQR